MPPVAVAHANSSAEQHVVHQHVGLDAEAARAAAAKARASMGRQSADDMPSLDKAPPMVPPNSAGGSGQAGISSAKGRDDDHNASGDVGNGYHDRAEDSGDVDERGDGKETTGGTQHSSGDGYAPECALSMNAEPEDVSPTLPEQPQQPEPDEQSGVADKDRAVEPVHGGAVAVCTSSAKAPVLAPWQAAGGHVMLPADGRGGGIWDDDASSTSGDAEVAPMNQLMGHEQQGEQAELAQAVGAGSEKDREEDAALLLKAEVVAADNAPRAAHARSGPECD